MFQLKKSAFTAILFLCIAHVFFTLGCKKLNDATTIGSNLIPPIDNIHTFQTLLKVTSDNKFLNDSTKLLYADLMPVGHISNDPEFGSAHANGYLSFFNAGSSYGYPFGIRDSLISIDSAIVSLSVGGIYGDSSSSQTFRVYEIAQNAHFDDTSTFKILATPDFNVLNEIGSKTVALNHIKDSVFINAKVSDSVSKTANVIRIPIRDASFISRFKNYDTSTTANVGAYHSDSAFNQLFKGLAIKADNSGSAMVYISPSDLAKTKIVFYYRYKTNGLIDTTTASFDHESRLSFDYNRGLYRYYTAQATAFKQTPSSNYASYLFNSTVDDNKVYLTTAPGSFSEINIPALDTFKNCVINRAELVVHTLRSNQDTVYTYPIRLFLDKINNTNDTAFVFETDMGLSLISGGLTYNPTTFGGFLGNDSVYRFTLTRYVQNIVTNKTKNFKLRLYAPLRSYFYSQLTNYYNFLSIPNQVGFGRVVLAGGSFADLNKRMYLRLVYSKI